MTQHSTGFFRSVNTDAPVQVVNTLDHTAIALDAAWDVQGLYDLAAELGARSPSGEVRAERSVQGGQDVGCFLGRSTWT